MVAAMLNNGKYAAWYKTPGKQGTGVIHLLDGTITGSDSVLTYSGTYEVSGDEFTAVLNTTRHSRGQETIFGADNLSLRIKGKVVGRTARFTGAADEFPDIPFEGTLIHSEQEQPKANREAPAFDRLKLLNLVQPR